MADRGTLPVSRWALAPVSYSYSNRPQVDLTCSPVNRPGCDQFALGSTTGASALRLMGTYAWRSAENLWRTLSRGRFMARFFRAIVVGGERRTRERNRHSLDWRNGIVIACGMRSFFCQNPIVKRQSSRLKITVESGNGICGSRTLARIMFTLW